MTALRVFGWIVAVLSGYWLAVEIIGHAGIVGILVTAVIFALAVVAIVVPSRRQAARETTGTQTVTTTSGYTVKITWHVTDPTVSVDVANAPPGRANLFFKTDGNFEVVVKNMTPGKNLSTTTGPVTCLYEVLISQDAYELLFPGEHSINGLLSQGDLRTIHRSNQRQLTKSLAPGRQEPMPDLGMIRARDPGGPVALGTVDESQVRQAVALLSHLSYLLTVSVGRETFNIKIGW